MANKINQSFEAKTKMNQLFYNDLDLTVICYQDSIKYAGPLTYMVTYLLYLYWLIKSFHYINHTGQRLTSIVETGCMHGQTFYWHMVQLKLLVFTVKDLNCYTFELCLIKSTIGKLYRFANTWTFGYTGTCMLQSIFTSQGLYDFTYQDGFDHAKTFSVKVFL